MHEFSMYSVRDVLQPESGVLRPGRPGEGRAAVGTGQEASGGFLREAERPTNGVLQERRKVMEQGVTLDAKAIIGNELAVVDINEVRIAKMREEYMPLVITDLKNEKQFDTVHRARMEVKKSRVLIQNVSKKTREKAVLFQKDCIAEEKRLIGLIEPIEAHLESEEGKVEAEKARLKAEAEAKEEARLQDRINALVALGCNFNGQAYFYGTLTVPVPMIKALDDVQFGNVHAEINKAVVADAEKKAKEEADRKAEAERIAKVAAEQEAERVRLEEQARKIEQEQEIERARLWQITHDQDLEAKRIREAQDAIDAEKKRLADAEAARLKAIEDEKQRVEDEKRRAEEMEQAKKEAAEKARIEAEEKIKREAEDKAKREEAARIAAEKKAARRPDKEKLLLFANSLNGLPLPEMKTMEGKTTLGQFKEELSCAIHNLRVNAEAL
ncbi:MAG: hypothetical protein ACYDG4_13360 [Desulfuromonadaceae bacterium]